MDVETLSHPEIKNFSESQFISLKYNANSELGGKYFQDYNCQGVPHIVFIDSSGVEVDRIIGYLSPTEYLIRIQDIVSKRNTLTDYLSRYNNGEYNIDIIAGIAMKYEDRKENDKAADYFSILLEEYPNEHSEYHKKAKFFLAVHQFKNGNENILIDYIKDNQNSKKHLDAYKEMIFYYVDTQQIEKELNLYKEILSKFSNNPKILNMYAWRMAEIEINLEDALAKAQKAIYLMNDDPKRANIIDTEAEIFWKMKQYDNAIKTIDLAIQINPQNQYYKDQRKKFLDSKMAVSVDL